MILTVSAASATMATLAPFELPLGLASSRLLPQSLDRLPGSRTDDSLLQLAAGWLVGYPAHTAAAYRRDLEAWTRWCALLDVHPLAAKRHHVDLWVRYLTTQPQPRTGRPAAPATVARKLSALSGFYDYGVYDAQVLTYSPVTSARRPGVSADRQTLGLTGDELGSLLVHAAQHSPRSLALVSLIAFGGLRISEALNADIRDYEHGRSHGVLRVTRKSGKTARVALAPPVAQTLDDYLDGRTAGRIFIACNSESHYSYKTAREQIARLCRRAGLPAGVTPHSLRQCYATESLRRAAALQDVQDALGHAGLPSGTTAAATTWTAPPNYLLDAALTTNSSSS